MIEPGLPKHNDVKCRVLSDIRQDFCLAKYLSIPNAEKLMVLMNIKK
jgi:hypothetical protein